MRKRLTEDNIDALKAKAKRYIVMDSLVPWLGVRVAPSGRKTFVMVGRFDSKHPTRRSLGKLTLDAARAKVRTWHDQLSQGIDLKRNTFGEVAGQFFTHIRKQRRAEDAERIIRRELASWWDRPLSSITKHEAIKAIDAVKDRGTPCAAHHLLAHMRRVFNYAVGRSIIEHSPCDRLKPSGLIGPKVVRQRVLNDDELRALWRASVAIGYPYGHLWQLLLVTGARRSEGSGARWREVDRGNALWTIPPERFKSNAKHLVPLSPLAMQIINSLPQGTGDALLFGHLNGWGKAKKRLDEATGKIAPFVIHDLRRTVRTRLSELRVPDHIAEMVIGHGRKGIARVYDQHKYVDEMREALDAWAQRLQQILRGSIEEGREQVHAASVEPDTGEQHGDRIQSILPQAQHDPSGDEVRASRSARIKSRSALRPYGQESAPHRA